jgi:hypothetical protein
MGTHAVPAKCNPPQDNFFQHGCAGPEALKEEAEGRVCEFFRGVKLDYFEVLSVCCVGMCQSRTG